MGGLKIGDGICALLMLASTTVQYSFIGRRQMWRKYSNKSAKANRFGRFLNPRPQR